jgi:outer membrane cobalamin receptor
MRLSSLLATVAVIAAPSVAIAKSASSPSSVDEVMVTASRLDQSPATTPYAVSVLHPPVLSGARSLADALATLADVSVQAPGGRSGIASLFLRGSDPNFTAILVDGVPLNNPTNTRGGSVNISELGGAEFERAEVVSGPLSSLYGSGALAGAVNLIVPAGTTKSHLDATLGLGTQSDYSALLRWRGPVGGGYGASLAVGADEDGDGVPNSSFRSWTLTGKLAPLNGASGSRLVLRIAETDVLAFPDSSGGPRLAVRRGTDSRQGREALIGAQRRLISQESFQLDLSASFLTRRDETSSPGVAPSKFNPGGVPAGHDDTHYSREMVQAVGRLDVADWKVAAGVEAQREDARDIGVLNFGILVPNSFQGGRSTYSGFMEVGRQTPAWALNAGARLDAIDGLGVHLTGRSGARYNFPGSRFSLRASVGGAFKAPSFYALGNPFVGNRNLAPEKSLAEDVGLVWTGAGGDSFALSLYHTQFTGLIDFIPGPPPRLENRSVVISQGVSATLVKSLGPRLALSVQIHDGDTHDGDTGQRLANRPRWTTVSNITWTPVDALALTGRFSTVGARDDFSTPTGSVTLDGYQTLSLEGAWTFPTATAVRLIVEDALGERHEDAVGFPSPGRRARLILSRQF